jgi:serine/threonine protein kinase/tetratricopeptide (TPR) repeat protein
MATIIGQTVSHYKILEKLGEGGMGVVYKAEDNKLKRIVALKFLPPSLTSDLDAKERFTHEAQATSALDHPHICNIHEIGQTDDGQLFIAMACYDGETLKKKIERGPLPTNEAVGIAAQIAQGLAKAHESGIVHRDIKPANIIVTKDGIAKILDFGLAKLTGRTMLTKTGSTLGTAAYMSPEQARGEPLDPQTDIWSLGVAMYEMLTGCLPFKSDYEQALVYSILNEDPKPMREICKEVPQTLEKIVRRAIRKNPEERYQTAGELVTDLEAFRAGSRLAKRTESIPVNRRKLVFLAGTAAAVLIVIGLTLFFPHGEDANPVSHLKMIAVLPFENLGTSEDEYFADGLTEEISSRLGSVSGLGVISRQSTMQYRKSPKTLPVVAKELGVDYALTATIRWVRTGTGQRIRITPHLIQVAGDLQLWSETYDRTLDDIFLVQAEIATHVVGALGVALKEEERGTIDAIPTRNLEAYEAFLRAKAAMSVDYEETNGRMAIEMLERAVKLDTSFALAHVGLSMAHLSYYWAGFDRTMDRLALCKKALDKAVALEPDMPEALGALTAYYYWGHRDYEKALATVNKVAEKLPNDSRISSTRAYIWRRQGKFDEASEELKKAATLNPRDASLMREVGNMLFQLGRYSEAERFFDRAISLSPEAPLTYIIKSNMYLRWGGDTRKSREVLELVPTVYSPWGNLVELEIYDRKYHAALDRLAKAPAKAIIEQHGITPATQFSGLVYRFLGDTAGSRKSFDDARVYLESELMKRTDDSRLRSSLGIVYAGLGRREEAIQQAERAAELMPLSRDAVEGVYPLIALAQVHTLLGNQDAALDRLEYLLSLHAPKLLTPSLLRIDPIYEPLRGTPRFQGLLAKEKRM